MITIRQLYIKTYYTAIAVLTAFLFVSCCASAKKTGENKYNKTYEIKALKKYKGEITYLFNNSNSHVICINQNKTTQFAPHPTADFFIFDIAADSIVFEQSSVNAAVKWITGTTAEVIITPEIINEDDAADNKSFIFDIVKKKKILKKDF